MNPSFKIAAIAGDGIGKEVMPEGLRVLDAAAASKRGSKPRQRARLRSAATCN